MLTFPAIVITAIQSSFCQIFSQNFVSLKCQHRLFVLTMYLKYVSITEVMGKRKNVVLPESYNMNTDRKLHEMVAKVMLRRVSVHSIHHEKQNPSCTIDKYFAPIREDTKVTTLSDSNKVLEQERDLSILLGEKVLILEEEICKKNARIKFLEDQLERGGKRENENQVDIVSDIDTFLSELNNMRESNLGESPERVPKSLDVNPGSPDLKSDHQRETKLAQSGNKSATRKVQPSRESTPRGLTLTSWLSKASMSEGRGGKGTKRKACDLDISVDSQLRLKSFSTKCAKSKNIIC